MTKHKYLFFLIPILLGSCHKYQLTTMHLKENEYLLKKNKVVLSGDSDVGKDNLALYVRQKPNRSIFFGSWKAPLQWKNIWYREGKDEKNKKPRAAVIVDTSLIARSEKQMKIYLQNLGYYNATVETEVRRSRIFGVKKWQTKKQVVTYHVKTGQPYFIDSIGSEITDSTILELHSSSLSLTSLKKGSPLRVEDLQVERERLAKEFQNHGYYDFAQNYILFDVDTNRGGNSTAIITKIKQPKNSINTHYQYRIRNIYVQTDYDAFESTNAITDTMDFAPHVYFLSKTESKFKPAPIYRSLFIKPEKMYSVSAHNTTYKQLLNLQMFSSINIYFEKTVVSDSTLVNRQLDVFVKLTPAKKMSISAEATATFREGFGANGQVSISSKNPFGGSEIFEFSIAGGFENLKSSTAEKRVIGANVGPRLSIQFPSLLFFPKLNATIAKNAFPKSTVSINYNFQKRLDFTRHISNLYLKYAWNEGSYKKHELNVLDFSLSFIEKDSKILLDLSSLTASEKFRFEDNISSGIKYRFTFNDKNKPGIKHPMYFIAQGSLIGLSSVLTKALGIEKRDVNNAISLLGIRYSNYFKADFDFRKYVHLNKNNVIAVRGYVGGALPLDKNSVIPFEKLFFSGGANSVRGWQQRTLGPGKYYDEENFYDRLGELKLEGSLEYRFPISSVFKGAAFVDVGNIWNIKNENTEANFNVGTFYEQIAVSPGLGIRLDFDFFLFRVDTAYPMKSPRESTFTPFARKLINWNFGIGYPF